MPRRFCDAGAPSPARSTRVHRRVEGDGVDVTRQEPDAASLPGSARPSAPPGAAPREVRAPRAGGRGLALALAALRVGPAGILIVLVVVLALLSDVFLSLENVGNVLKQSAVICVLALGQLLVIVTRGIDLSVGSNLSLSAVVGAIVWRDHGSAALCRRSHPAHGEHGRPDQRTALREGPPAAPLHPHARHALGGERAGPVPLAERDHPGRSSDRRRDRCRADRGHPRG